MLLRSSRSCPLQKRKRDKSRGVDGIPAEFWKAVCHKDNSFCQCGTRMGLPSQPALARSHVIPGAAVRRSAATLCFEGREAARAVSANCSAAGAAGPLTCAKAGVAPPGRPSPAGCRQHPGPLHHNGRAGQAWIRHPARCWIANMTTFGRTRCRKSSFQQPPTSAASTRKCCGPLRLSSG